MQQTYNIVIFGQFNNLPPGLAESLQGEGHVINRVSCREEISNFIVKGERSLLLMDFGEDEEKILNSLNN